MDAFEALKTLGPYVSGGLAGAVLKMAYDHWQGKVKAKTFTVIEEKIEYKLPGASNEIERKVGIPGASTFKPLRVSYDGKDYARLSYYSLRVKNGKVPLTSEALFVVSMTPGTTVLAHQTIVNPIPFDVTMAEDASKGLVTFTTPALRPGDSIELRLLLNGNPPTWHYRGSEDVTVIDGGPQLERHASLIAHLVAAVARVITR